jgi:hypothetical protein
MKIEKKILPEFFEKILSGEKTFELRLADFECKPGDVLILKEWDPKTGKYSGRRIEKKVTYALRTKDVHFWPEKDVKKHGYQIISFK